MGRSGGGPDHVDYGPGSLFIKSAAQALGQT